MGYEDLLTFRKDELEEQVGEHPPPEAGPGLDSWKLNLAEGKQLVFPFQ